MRIDRLRVLDATDAGLALRHHHHHCLVVVDGEHVGLELRELVPALVDQVLRAFNGLPVASVVATISISTLWVLRAAC